MSDEAATEAVLDILAPKQSWGRSPIFEWGHETTPTEREMRELAAEIVTAVKAATAAEGTPHA